jgi:hypothetical protein
VSRLRFSVVVAGQAPPAATYAYLADPRTRPAWQSSLRGIEDLRPPADGADAGRPGAVGTTWTDVTVAGVRPRMRVTEAEPERALTEVGRWRSVTAELRMLLEPRGSGTRVTAEVAIETPGPLAPVGWGLRLLVPVAVRGDLRRAVRLASDARDRPDTW